MIVVDSNVLAVRNVTGIQTWLAEQVEAQDPVWIVPLLWRYEFQKSEGQGQIYTKYIRGIRGAPIKGQVRA